MMRLYDENASSFSARPESPMDASISSKHLPSILQNWTIHSEQINQIAYRLELFASALLGPMPSQITPDPVNKVLAPGNYIDSADRVSQTIRGDLDRIETTMNRLNSLI